ncbi:MAG: glycosyltransferase [Myxococcota bacterium]
MKKISACLIVKNEEEMLEPCLKSLQGVVDEIIVVDTGSTDGTVDIIKKYGCNLQHFEWINDFAAARNYAKSFASGDYMLVIDADERVEPSCVAGFRQFVERETFDIGVIPLHQATSKTAEFEAVVSGEERSGNPVLLPRVLTLQHEWEYEGAVHETPSRDLQSWARYMFVPLHVIHHGADTAWRESRQKSDRNLKLIEEQIDEYNESPLHWGYLVSELMNANRKREAYRALEKGWEAVKASIDNGHNYPISFIASLYPQYCFERERPVEALEALQIILKYSCESHVGQRLNPNVLYSCGNVLLRTDIPEGFSSQCYELLKDLSDVLISMRNMAFLEEQVSGYTTIRAHELKGAAYLYLNQLDEALEEFNKALKFHTTDASVRLFIAETHITMGQHELALESLLAMMQLIKQPDPWVLASLACIDMGLDEQAKDFWEQAEIRASQIAFVHSVRRRLLSGLRVMFQTLDGEPVSGKGVYGVLGAIASRKPLQTTKSVPSPIIAQVINRFLELERFDLIEPFLEPRAQHILPGIGDWVKRHLVERGFSFEYDGIMPLICLAGKVDPVILSIIERTTRIQVCKLDDSDMNKIKAAKESPSDFLSWIRHYPYNPRSERLLLYHPELHSHFTSLVSVAPETRFVYFYINPRAIISGLDGEARTNALTEWRQTTLALHKSLPNLSCFSHTDFFVHGRSSVDEFLAYLGEVWEEEFFAAINGLKRDELDLNEKQELILIEALSQYASGLEQRS